MTYTNAVATAKKEPSKNAFNLLCFVSKHLFFLENIPVPKLFITIKIHAPVTVNEGRTRI